MSNLKTEALEYHRRGRPGKLEVVPTKPCLTSRDLSLAYTPGVAEPCLAIEKDPHLAFDYTNRGNLVAVVSNGTAVLGLGDIGALAGKPVMEGKAVLFKRFAQVDVFDIEIDTKDPEEVIRTCELLEPTFGGINLEDIKAPDCFVVEERLKKSLSIPVFHDDQHGTAIISGAALINAATLVGKQLSSLKVVVSGAGASALACARFYELLGIPRANFLLCDTKGVVYKGRREGMNEYKEYFAQDTPKRTLAEALQGADVFLGCSVAGLLTPEMLKTMADKPIIFALANPNPEITYEDAKSARPDAIVATGRSDFPNQVNNVLGFPFVFRGALDVRASQINEPMKLAAAHALAALAREPVPDEVGMAYGGTHFEFGPDYIIPKPFDPRLMRFESLAVAKAACETGVAQEPIEDWAGYEARLEAVRSRSEIVMQRIRSGATSRRPAIVFTEGENPRVIQACRLIVQERTGKPILVGRTEAIEEGCRRAALPLDEVQIVDPSNSERLPEFAKELARVREREGMTPAKARRLVQAPVAFGLMMVRLGQADAAIIGADDAYSDSIRSVVHLIDTAATARRVAGFHIMLLDGHVYVIGDSVVNIDPDAALLAEIALQGADLARDLGLAPKVALLSFSNFGDNSHPKARKVRNAVELLRQSHRDLVCDGEMHGDVAVRPEFAEENFPFSRIQGDANVLICPDLDSANIATKLVASIGQRSEVIGPILEGLDRPVNIVSFNSTAREIANLAEYSAYRCCFGATPASEARSKPGAAAL